MSVPAPFLHVCDPFTQVEHPIDNEAWRLATELMHTIRGVDNEDIIHRIYAIRFQDALRTGERRVISAVLPQLEQFSPDRRRAERRDRRG